MRLYFGRKWIQNVSKRLWYKEENLIPINQYPRLLEHILKERLGCGNYRVYEDRIEVRQIHLDLKETLDAYNESDLATLEKRLQEEHKARVKKARQEERIRRIEKRKEF